MRLRLQISIFTVFYMFSSLEQTELLNDVLHVEFFVSFPFIFRMTETTDFVAVAVVAGLAHTSIARMIVAKWHEESSLLK